MKFKGEIVRHRINRRTGRHTMKVITEGLEFDSSSWESDCDEIKLGFSVKRVDVEEEKLVEYYTVELSDEQIIEAYNEIIRIKKERKK